MGIPDLVFRLRPISRKSFMHCLISTEEVAGDLCRFPIQMRHGSCVEQRARSIVPKPSEIPMSNLTSIAKALKHFSAFKTVLWPSLANRPFLSPGQLRPYKALKGQHPIRPLRARTL